ncbi:MAG: SAM-dependent methyltransferase [Mogibacterium sp.]|nr:SAM-dependent methyltransferase [Mogibacterium sp.]
MRLSKRIYKIAEKVDQGETVADIGTDHGYVPMILIRDKISPRAIMSDISEGSLAKAAETFELCGLEADEADFRVGDGLDTVAPAEVDSVIIGGLGGFTIIDILDADISKSKSFKKLILQPRKHSGNLRYYLYTHGWDIADEDLAPEGKFVCEVITAVPSEHYRPAPYPEEDIRWKYPAAIIDADRELAVKRISWKIGSITEELENLKKSTKDNSELTAKLESDREYLKGIIR